MGTSGKRWLPLESNPEVMNTFVKKLGIDTSLWGFCDIFGMDPDLLMMVPQPVIAVLMVFPITEASEKARAEEEEKIARDGQDVSPNVWYTRQTVGNACGTIGLIHSLANNAEVVPMDEGAFMKKFLKGCEGLDPMARAKYLEEPPAGAPDIEEAHQEAAAAGDTAPPEDLENVNLHFVAFVHKEGSLYELDGRKQRPINHGASTPETLLQDACKVASDFMKRSESLNFNLVALASAQ